MKTKFSKTATIALFSVPLLIGVYLIYRQLKKPRLPKNLSPLKEPDKQTQAKINAAPVSAPFPLKKGSKGAKVKELQQILLSYDNKLLPKYKDDGDFGSETEAALVYVTGNKKSIINQEELDTLRKQVNDFNNFNKSFQTTNPWSGVFL